MNVYNALYPYAVMALAFIAATSSIIGGGTTSLMIMQAPIKEGDSRAGNIFGGSVVFILSCGAAMLSLYVGGKFTGAF